MIDLAPQLQAYIDGIADPVTSGEVRTRASMAGRRRRSRRSLAAALVALTAVAVAAAVVVSIGLGSGDDTTDGVVAGGPTTSAADVSPAELASGWQRVAFAEAGLPADATIYDVEYGHGVFVAVGTMEGGAAAWSSPDGRTWTTRLGAGGEIAGFLKLVAASSDGFTALGGDPTGWYSYRSPDGLTWEQAAGGPDVLPGAPTTDAEFALAGTSDSGDLVAGEGGGLVLLNSGFAVSTDGRSFEPVSPPREDADRDFKAITPTGRGFAALGTAVRSGGLDTVVWSSPDGVGWARDGAVVGREGVATALAADGDTLVVAKQVVAGDHAGEVWRSPDAGVTWEEQPAFAADFPRSTIRDLVRAGDVWVALGATDREVVEVADAWVSPDGSTWVAMPPDLRALGRLRVAATDGNIVVAPGLTYLYLWSPPEPSATPTATSASTASAAATTAWRPAEGFGLVDDPDRDTDDELRDYVYGVLEVLRTMETAPNWVGLVSFDGGGSTATAIFHRETFDDDSVSGQDFRVHLRRGPNGWYVESAEVRDVCPRGLGTDGNSCL